MNRKQLKTSAKTVLHKNFFAAILFILVFHTITGRLGAEIALLFTLIKFEPSYTSSAEEQIGFTGNIFLSNTATIASIIAVVLLLAVYSIFLIGPLTVAKANFFLKARTDSFKTNYIFDVFKDDSYGNILKAMAVRNMIIILGSLLIFPGIYLSLIYYFVPQVAADNQNCNWKDILRMSRDLTRGSKLRLSILYMSFFGW